LINKSSRRDKIWAYVIGSGLVLFAVHNPLQPLKEYAFLPVLGLTISVLGVFVVLSDRWKEITLGDKRVWIPLAVIVASIAGSGFVNPISPEITALFVPMLFGVCMFGVYLVARMLGKELFVPFAWAVVISSLGCIGYGIVLPGMQTGGILNPTNYDIATGLLVFGTVVAVFKRQWILVPIALVGLFFTGSPEAVFVVPVLGIIVLARRDWSRRLFIPLGAVIVIVGIWMGLGHGLALYDYSVEKVNTVISAPTEGEIDVALTGRWHVIKRAMSDIRPLGHRFAITEFTTDTVHNVPLIITDQVGPLAAVAWLWVTIFCLVKTRWKYAFAGVLALSLFDHFVWTQVAPWWWCLIGVSTTSDINSDLIFKKNRGG